METDFSVNVQIELGIKPEVVELVTMLVGKAAFIGNVPATSVEHKEEDAPTVERPKTRKSPKAKETETATAETAKEPQQTVATSAPTEQAAEPTTDKSKEEVKKEFTEEDVRAAMHKTRQRIEGEDYKEHTDSEAYKKYHKELTSMFKNIAATLGAEKPSTLEAGKREDFIKACDDLAILEDGTIGYTIPF